MKNLSPKKRHAHMVYDSRRTTPLLHAISKVVEKDDIVLDIGTGLGILAIWAARSGAKHVWAIDCDSAALSAARRNAARAKVLGKITFIEGLSFGMSMSEKADLVISETVGSFAFDENILLTLSDAKKRLLKKNGKIIPQIVELWGAPLSFIPKTDPISETALVKKDHFISPPKCLASVNFNKKFSHTIHIKKTFVSEKNTAIKGFAVWPEISWHKKDETSASPLSPKTHWKQGILPVRAKKVGVGSKIELELIVKPHPENPFKMTERLWKVKVS